MSVSWSCHGRCCELVNCSSALRSTEGRFFTSSLETTCTTGKRSSAHNLLNSRQSLRTFWTRKACTTARYKVFPIHKPLEHFSICDHVKMPWRFKVTCWKCVWRIQESKSKWYSHGLGVSRCQWWLRSSWLAYEAEMESWLSTPLLPRHCRLHIFCRHRQIHRSLHSRCKNTTLDKRSTKLGQYLYWQSAHERIDFCQFHTLGFYHSHKSSRSIP